MTLPLIRLQPWYMGQVGVYGSDVQRGLRWSPTAIVLYVDENHPNTSNVADGTDPEYPLNSIQTAITRLINFQTAMATSLVGSVIVVGAGASLTESVIVPPTAPKGITILGEANGSYMPTWTAATAAGTALIIRQENWRVSGINFTYTGAGTGVRLELVAANAYNASGAVIDGCRFTGWWNGLYGIDLFGAPYNVRILNNEFTELRTGSATAFAVITTGSSYAEPLECEIVGNVFWENENHVGSLNNVRSFNVSLIQGNIFGAGKTIATTIKLDLRSNHGGHNVVVGNTFCGLYSNPGGYWDSTDSVSMWNGNFAQDTAQPEVGPDAITIAPPVA